MKSERGSITLFVLIAMLFFIGVSLSAYISAMNKLQGQNEELAQIKQSYEQELDDQSLQTLYDKLTSEYFEESSTINGESPSSNNPTIPAGFKPVDTETSSWGDGTTAPTEEAVNAGLVIEDEDGNQFVWIPVDGTNLKYEKHTYETTSVEDTVLTADTGNGNWPTYYYRNYSDWTDDGGNSVSVAKYGGFYVARYEAGVPEDESFYASEDGDTYYTDSKNVTTYIPVSKQGVPVWNYISQENALEVSSKMYNTSSVKSSLIDSYAWDTITQWLSNSNYDVTDSRTYGNYYDVSFTFNGLYATHIYESSSTSVVSTYSKGEKTKATNERTETATGVSERNKTNNIYDFAGNMWEWTTEVGLHGESTTEYAVLRGGCFSDDIHAPVSTRSGYYSTDSSGFSWGFRVVLYLN